MQKLVGLLLLFGFLGCTTPMKEQIGKIEMGMDKSQVIEELGSPYRSFRREGEDIWLYQIYDEAGAREIFEVGFADGNVTYTGAKREPKPRPTPPRTPEEADQILRTELKKDPLGTSKEEPHYQDIREDGTFNEN